MGSGQDLPDLAGPIQHFKTAILGAWRCKVSAGLCPREGVRGDPLLEIVGSQQLLNPFARCNTT